MNIKSKGLRYRLKQVCLKISTPLIAAAAIGCAFLVETGHINYAYPLEMVLKGIINDSVILTINSKLKR